MPVMIRTCEMPKDYASGVAKAKVQSLKGRDKFGTTGRDHAGSASAAVEELRGNCRECGECVNFPILASLSLSLSLSAPAARSESQEPQSRR